MQKQIILTILSLVVCIATLTGCPTGGNIPKGWTYKPDYANQGASIVQTPDGGFFVVGVGLESEDAELQTFAAKLDGAMNLSWSQLSINLYPIAGGVVPTDLLGVYDNEAAVLCGVNMKHDAFSEGRTRLRVQAIDSTGGILWDDIHSPDLEWQPDAMTKTGDGGYLIVSYAWSPGMNQTILLRLDADGEEVWNKDIAEGRVQRIYRARLLPSGDFMLTGFTSSPDYSTYGQDMMLIRVDAVGDVVWFQEYSLERDQQALGLGLMPDGGFVLAGTDQGKPYVIRTDPEGEVIWARHDVMGFEPTQNDYSLYDVAVGPGDSITIVGYGQTLGTAGPLPTVSKTRFVMQLDGDGNNRWTTDIRPAYGYGITYTTEGTYMVCGTAFTRQGQVLNLLELDQTGKVLD